MSDASRRDTLKLLAASAAAAGAAAAGAACSKPTPTAAGAKGSADAILSTAPLGFQWKVADPFLFCVHHDDRYPAGNDRMGPQASLDGRNMGQDFEGKDGWRMYHGEVVPGFPQHPHRGFETITVVRRGLLDHSDSLGATARYGGGDVQWLTAGRGIQHAEMFPLLDRQQANPLELFQIWLNLPSVDKMAPPVFSMFWNRSIPRTVVRDQAGRTTELTIVAGRYGAITPPAPPPNSWAARPDTDLAIWTLRMAPGARFVLPPARPGTNRSLYPFMGAALRLNGAEVPANHQLVVRPERELTLEAGAGTDRSVETEILMLQGRPIGEPVAQYGPFVMNTEEEIRQAFVDYRATQFGGWPWAAPDPVHDREKGRFALHVGGRLDKPA